MTALLIAPDRGLAARLQEAVAQTRAFQILADLAKYPAPGMLEIRLRQLRPAAVLLDLAADEEAACEVIRAAAAHNPPTLVVGLDHASRPEVVMRALRLGACEFLAAPFEPQAQKQVAEAVRRLAGLEETPQPEPGKILAFASAKPGSGASVLACQTAYELARQTRQRVLLMDLDLAEGAVAYYTGLEHDYSFLDLLDLSAEADPAAVGTPAAGKRGVDVLPAPPVPRLAPEDPVRARRAFDYVKRVYQWTVLDLPCIFERLSLLALAETDRTYLVVTPELASLHVARKATLLLSAAGVGPDRFEVILNRAGRKESLPVGEVSKILHCAVGTVLPEDHGALYAAAAAGEPLRPDSLLGATLARMVEQIAGTSPAELRNGGALFEPGPVFAGT